MPSKTIEYVKNVYEENMGIGSVTYRAHHRVHNQIDEINKKIKMERE